MNHTTVSIHRAALIAALIGLVATSLLAATLVASTPAAAQNSGYAVTDGDNSTNAFRLLDGTVGPASAQSWENVGNRWSNGSYSQTAVIDLGANQDVVSMQIYAGQVPFPSSAALDISLASAAAPNNFTQVATLTNPTYDAWSTAIAIGASARYIRVSFSDVSAHFNVAEIAVQTDAATTSIEPLTAVDGANSISASRMTDAVAGAAANQSWWNPNIWSSSAYPMSATIELPGAYDVSKIEYFVGNLNIGTDQLDIEYSTASSGENFQPLAAATNHDWNVWSALDVAADDVQRIRLSFASPAARFNVAEIRLTGVAAGL